MGLICYTLGKIDSFYCKFFAEGRPGKAVEIRLDLCEFNDEQIKDIFSTPRESYLVASAGASRTPESEKKALMMLSTAILSGADYVEISLDMVQSSRSWLISLAMNKGCKIILSYLNSRITPSTDELSAIVDKALQEGADIVKIVTKAEKTEDNNRLIALYDKYKPQTLIAFATGLNGVESRLESYHKGAPLFYIAPRRGYETTEGEPCYFDFIMPQNKILEGVPQLPAAKSIAQRAILLAALTEGKTKIYGFTACGDAESALALAMQLGAEVEVDPDGSTVTIIGHQNLREKGLVAKESVLSAGESGLLARLCIPLAGLSDNPITITGEKSLLLRKVSEHKGALRKMGLKLEYTDGHYLPVTVNGKLKGANCKINGVYGTQMLSGMMLALSQCEKDSVLHIERMTGAPYLDMTATIGMFFGLKDPSFPEDEYDLTRTYFIEGRQNLKPVVGMELEKDWSTAAFFMVAGAMLGDITIKGLKFDSEQADAMIYDFLDKCHLDIVKRENGDINVRKSIICPFAFDLVDAPDLFAPLVVLALRASGESCIEGLNRLKNKESGRARRFIEEFRAIGADMFIAQDGCLYIEGNERLMLEGGRCFSYGDHRLAMALSIASLISKNPVIIDDTDCIAKSFPDYLKVLESLKKK